jgi:hypothetical protein
MMNMCLRVRGLRVNVCISIGLIWLFLLAHSAAFDVSQSIVSKPLRVAEAFFRSEKNDVPFWLQASPLIGGPSWLPIHVKVVVSADTSAASNGVESLKEQFAFDFVPVDATSPSTMAELLQLKHVEGTIRKVAITKPSMEEPVESRQDRDVIDPSTADQAKTCPYLAAADDFCERNGVHYRRLHLVQKNCWFFALSLLNELDETHRQYTTI